MSKKLIKWETLPKFLVRRYKEAIGPNGLMLVHEHHGDRYFHIKDEKSLCEALITIMRAWIGYYIYEPTDGPPKTPEVSLEKASELPERYRKIAEEEWKTYHSSLKEYQQEVDNWEMVQALINKKDYVSGLIALSIIAKDRDPGIEFIEME